MLAIEKRVVSACTFIKEDEFNAKAFRFIAAVRLPETILAYNKLRTELKVVLMLDVPVSKTILYVMLTPYRFESLELIRLESV
jgi:hypothetical protein